MSEDIRFDDRKEGDCRSKNNCAQYAKKFSSYPCINDPYKGNDFNSVLRNNNCLKILSMKKRNGRYMTPEECNKHMTASRVCYCTDDYCNGI